MSRVLVMLAAVGALWCAAQTAVAASKPSFGPPESWVQVVPIPDAAPGAGSAATQTLLDDNQSRLGPDGDSYYNRRVTKILKPEGLVGFTSVSETWNPDTEKVTFHSLKIIRDGKAIDLLQGGGKMLVIRRETDLERAMIDGRITASQQIEGLQVGDIVDVAWTHVSRDPILGGHSYDMEALNFSGQAARYRVRISWPDDAKVLWRPTAGYGKPTLSHAGGRTWLELDQSNVEVPKPPVGAPARFRRLGMLEVSGFTTWRDVSRLMQPHYVKAATLAADSPIKAEAAAIAAATKDPKARAFAALRLVEDKTRYFFIGVGDGGYVPARADETWSRKFGDCKGKTVLLLALLHELGIEAEPALASIGGGDGIDERPPSTAAFNHVLVRATISGKVYWLDGTRTGDKVGLDALKPPNFYWVLPLRAAGADLERIDIPPPTEPMLSVALRMDASAGLDAPAPVTMTMVMRGEAATGMRQVLAMSRREDLERTMRQSMSASASWIDIQHIDWKDDVEHDAFQIRLDGKADMDWRKNEDIGKREYKVAQSTNTAVGFPRREPGPNSDAPYVVSYPMYIEAETDIVLPSGGAGFSVRGPNGDDVVGGMRLVRASGLKDGVAHFTVELRSVAREIPAADAEAARKIYRRLTAEESLVRAPG